MAAPLILPIELTPAVPIVQDAYANWSGIALTAFKTAQQLVYNLTDVSMSWTDFNIPFDVGAAPTPRSPPTAPIPLDVNDPGAPPAPPSFPAFSLTNTLIGINPPNENFSFTPGQYADDMLGNVKSTIKAMMAGDFVLPEPAATALRNRAFDAANKEEARNTDLAISDFAARGFDEPPGLLNARLVIVRDAAQLARMGANRDVYIQDQQIAQENLRAGVNAGVQLEQALMTLFTSQEQMQLEAAKFALDIAVQIFDARVRLAVALEQITAAEASAYSAQINALAEAYRAQIEGYGAVIKRIEVKKDVFLGDVELYKAQSEVILGANRNDVEAFRAIVAQKEAQLNALIKEADQNFEQVRFFTTLLQEAKKALATIQESLASAAMNAVHVGASLGYSGSESVSVGTSISGTLDD
jgi:hypothetical protein